MTVEAKAGTWLSLGAFVFVNAALVRAAWVAEDLGWRFLALAGLCAVWAMVAFGAAKQ